MKQFSNIKNNLKFSLLFRLSFSSYSISRVTLLKYTLVLNISLLFVFSESNAQSFLWADGYGTHTSESNGLVKCDSKGNTYIVGYSNDGASIGDVYLRETSRLLIKYSQSGDVVWVKTIGNNSIPYISDLYIDNQDQIYLLGNSESSFNCGNDTIKTSKTLTGFLISLDTEGQLIWQKHYNSTLRKVVVHDQQIYLMGTFTRYATFNNNHLVCNNVGYNGGLYLVKLNKEGDIILSKVFEGKEFDYVNMDISKYGSFYVCGNFNGDKLTINGKIHSCKNTNRNYFIAGFDKNAAPQWLSIRNSNNGYLSPVDILIDNKDDIYVAGNIIGNIDNFTTKNHDYGTFLFKYSSEGKLLWQKEFATNNSIGHTIVGFKGCALDIDTDNSLFMASSFMANFKIPDFKGENINIIKKGMSSDIFITKFHPLGYAQWVKVIGGDNAEWLSDLDIDNQKHVNIVGKYSSLNLYFDGKTINNNSGNYDPDAFAACLVDPTGIAPCPTLPVNILYNKTFLCKQDTLTLVANYAYPNNYQWKINGSILPYTNDSISIDMEGDYRLIVNEGTVCHDSSSILTIENKKLPVSTIFHDNTNIICEYDSVILKVNNFNNSTFKWLKNESLLESKVDSFYVAKEEGMYSIIMSNESCSQTDSVFIKKIGYPEITINSDTFSYQGTPIDIYPIKIDNSVAHWYYNYDVKEFSRKDKITTSLAGNYTIVVKNHCGIDVDQVFVNEEHNGISSKYLNNPSITLSPNPTYGNFNVAIDGFLSGECLIEILNIKGEVIYSQEECYYNNELKSIPINITKQPGTYFIRVTQNTKFIISKLLIY